MIGRDDERVARAALSRLVEPGERALLPLLERLGAAEVLRRLRSGALDEAKAEHWASRLPGCDPEADLDLVEALGGRFVVPGDAEWPTQLDDLAHLGPEDARHAAPPVGLWLRGGGDLRLLALRSVAVVGCRAATYYGGQVAKELGTELAERGWTVVSGAAFGIDAAAHRGALVGGATVAVVACGVDIPYPAAHTALLAAIARDGVVVSEVPPGSRPTRVRFLHRNRLIAALTRGTVVVEAAARSGAISTANFAERLSRVVAAVPGPVTSSQSEGCHRLLRRPGVVLARNSGDVIELVGAIGADAVVDASAPPTLFDALDETSLRVLEAVPRRSAAQAGSISRVAGLSLLTVQAALTRLEIAGLAERAPEGWRQARRP